MRSGGGSRVAVPWLAGALLLLAGVAQAIPYPGYYYPSGMQAGTKIRMVVGGTAMGGVTGAFITGDGVRVTRIVRVPSFSMAPGKTQRPWVHGWFYDIVEGKPGARKHRELPPEAQTENTDWDECLWWPYLDELGDLELQALGRFFYTPANYPQPTPALSTLLLFDVEADKDAEPGRRDIIIYDANSASAPHSFYITKEPHVQEKFFEIPPRSMDGMGKLPDVLHIPTVLPPQTPPCYLDGQAWPGEVDVFRLKLEKGQHLVCALTGRELLPYLGDAVPGFFNPEIRLLNEKGIRVAHADDFYYLPDPVLTYDVPEDGIYKLEVCDNLYRGRQDFVYFVHCYTTPDDRPMYTPRERAFECFPPAASHEIPQPTSNRWVKSGTLDCPGKRDRHYLDIKEPGEWRIELFARRQGSPVDGVMTLYGPMGNLPLKAAPRLVRWDDTQATLIAKKNVGDDDTPIIKTSTLYVGGVPQVECDPIGTWKFQEPGRYCVEVSDRVGAGGEYYDYTLVMEPLQPTFEVYAAMSALVLNGERPASFQAHILRKNGFKGEVRFESTEDWDVNGSFDEGQIETTVRIEANKDTWEGVKTVKLRATGELPNGEKITVTVTPCDPTEQAFAYTHLLPQRDFYLVGPAKKSLMEVFPHPLPHLGPKGKGVVKMKRKHSNGQACTACHDKKTRKHTHGKTCTACHKDKD